jgi:hypothetical protein
VALLSGACPKSWSTLSSEDHICQLQNPSWIRRTTFPVTEVITPHQSSPWTLAVEQRLQIEHRRTTESRFKPINTWHHLPDAPAAGATAGVGGGRFLPSGVLKKLVIRPLAGTAAAGEAPAGGGKKSVIRRLLALGGCRARVSFADSSCARIKRCWRRE